MPRQQALKSLALLSSGLPQSPTGAAACSVWVLYDGIVGRLILGCKAVELKRALLLLVVALLDTFAQNASLCVSHSMLLRGGCTCTLVCVCRSLCL